jgi:hypothetical protein
MNIHETSRDSLTVVVPIAFDPDATRRFLIAERVAAGSKSAMGHRCSNLVEQIKSYQAAADPAQRAYLEASIRRSVAEIHAIKDRRAIEAQRALAAQ